MARAIVNERAADSRAAQAAQAARAAWVALVALVTFAALWLALLAWSLPRAEALLGTPARSALPGPLSPELSDSSIEERLVRAMPGHASSLRVPFAAPPEPIAKAPSSEPPGSPSGSSSERRRREALVPLREASARLRFAPGEITLNARLRGRLERVLELLSRHPDGTVTVRVAGNELDGMVANRRQSRQRARAIVEYLISRGMARGRLELGVESGSALPRGRHRVRVNVENDTP